MKDKTKELLYSLFWTCDTLFRPTFRNITDSFESWAYRNGLLQQIRRLQQRQWLERMPAPNGERLIRLTEASRMLALGGRDPEKWWGRSWDEYWYQAQFDVPEEQSGKRKQLRRALRCRGFGCLQRSIWVTPGPADEVRALLVQGPVEVRNLMLMAAHPCGGECAADIVAGAWNFAEINRGYAEHRDILAQRPRQSIRTEAEAKAFQTWLRQERQAWSKAIERDPLLPQVLLPTDYLGCKAWKNRKKIMAKAAAQMRAFKAA